VTAGGGDLERALGAFLALDILEIDQRGAGLADLRLRARQHLGAAEVIGELDQRGGCDDLHLRAGPGGFGAASAGADQAFAAGIGADRGRQGLLVLLRSASGPLVRFPRMPLWCGTLGDRMWRSLPSGAHQAIAETLHIELALVATPVGGFGLLPTDQRTTLLLQRRPLRCV